MSSVVLVILALASAVVATEFPEDRRARLREIEHRIVRLEKEDTHE